MIIIHSPDGRIGSWLDYGGRIFLDRTIRDAECWETEEPYTQGYFPAGAILYRSNFLREVERESLQ